jgi:tetratricopeptide (TPR) repeat protein
LHEQGELDKAERLYAAILAAQPRHFEALQRLGALHCQRARPADALRYLSAALTVKPADAVALSNLGLAQASLRRPEEALASFDRALALKPDLVGALNNRGVALRDLGRPEEALASFERALALKPNYAEALNNRGNALRDLARSEEALASYERALALKPDYAEALANRGIALLELNRFEEALASCDRALALKPDYAEALNCRGVALRSLGRFEDALASYDRALALKPDHVEALNNRGNALRDLYRPEEALASFDRALALRPDFAEALANRSNALLDLDRAEEALASCGEALALKPDYAVAYDNKGLVLGELGRTEEASASIEEAIRLAPRRVRSYYNLTVSKRLTVGDPRIKAMEEMARGMPSLTQDDQIHLHFALAKALADVGDHERSFRRLLDGNALKRKRTLYDEAGALGSLQRTQATFTRQLMGRNEGRGEPSEIPVFIFGMPRSGTTLIEQILASHPKVFGAGEIAALAKAVARLDGGAGSASRFPEAVAQMSGAQLRQLGAVYVESVRASAPAAERITNKTTENFRFAGLIHLALPNARIIHARRNPIDACLSCFSTLFAGNIPFAYDLAELGRYYKAYDALMAHWRETLPASAMLEVGYEDVVADLEGQARRILAHCGLEWDARCLDFHRTERRVRTASAAQVRRPIYRSSVERWRAYEPWLGPLLAELQPLVDR